MKYILLALLTFTIGVAAFYLLRTDDLSTATLKTSTANADANALMQTTKPAQKPDDIIPRGLKEDVPNKKCYTNYVYGYFIAIPHGLVAYSDQSPQPLHGAGIIIAENPDSYLSVDGSYNAAGWESLDEAAKVNLEWLKKDFPNARLHKQKPSHLGGLPALRTVIKYERDGVNRKNETIFAFRKYEQVGIAYTVSLDTTEERYAEDVVKFEAIINSWKLRKIE